MKQYLVKGINGDYDVVAHHSGFDVGDLIEIPSGCNYYYDYPVNGIKAFSKVATSFGVLLWERNTTSDQEPDAENLISGKDALIAIANGQEVLVLDTRDSFKSLGWFNAFGLETNLFLGDTFYKFKLKPKTITVTLELPVPFTPKDGEWCYVTDCGSESGYYDFKFNPHCKDHINYIQFGAYRTEDEIKQVVEAYRGVKDAK